MKVRGDIEEYLNALEHSRKYGPQVVCHRKTAATEPVWDKMPPGLHPEISQMLRASGIKKLYSHQAEAINGILRGEDVLVATPTASGKSLIYNLPVLNTLFDDTPSSALYLYPLKALARDQRNTLEDLYKKLAPEEKGTFSALFDGDTNSYRRRKIRENPPRALLTNPEMVHLSLLPWHQSWSAFFSRLKYVVIDEVHSYRGITGSHVAWVLRRLQRIAAEYGSHPIFIMLSATIGNPADLGRELLGRKVEVITESGAPQAEKNMLFLNPWDSAAHTASQFLLAAVRRELRTIVYTQSRKMTELISSWTTSFLKGKGSQISAYRAGFLPEERREIEGRLFSGELLGVISTSALELGIDIGSLDLCLLVGYPGSIMATWQRGGRVGRTHKPSAIILIAGEDALDQHFMRDPDDFFNRSPEDAILNPMNPEILSRHLMCAAAEMPLVKGEALLQMDGIPEAVELLTFRGALLNTESGDIWLSPRKRIHQEVSLRGGGRQLAIIDTLKGEVIGEIDSGRAMKECHKGAIYLHRGRSWEVSELDFAGGEVMVREIRAHFHTRPLSEKQTEILSIDNEKVCFGIHVYHGRVRVRERVTGYQKRQNRPRKLLATIPLDLPEQVLETTGVWLTIPPQIVEKMEEEKRHFMGAIHALEHGMIALFPLLTLCDRNDIGGISTPLHPQTERASIFVYDGYPGGVGLSMVAFDKMEQLLPETFDSIRRCKCETGCPSCVHSPKCGSGNRPIDKVACLALLQTILTGNYEDLDISLKEKMAGGIEVSDNVSSYSTDLPDEEEFLGVDVLPEAWGVFDLETIRSADEVGGWNRADMMGVSVGVVYDSRLDDCVCYLEEDTGRLIEHIEDLELVVGFNNKRFDNQVLAGYTQKNLHLLPSLDLLEEVQNQLGYRLKLDNLSTHTLGAGKSADGLQALQWYKEGRIDLLQKYCRRDVEITRDIFLYALENRYLLFSNKAKQVVRLPLHLEKAVLRLTGRDLSP
jgi:DEAD/DEAH box helicase domain-containing protein